ncbi:MAG: type II toxin-antitoxin system RelE/ParE family toxin [Methylovulum sp.]|nr:MAG: type II toxin-antitoxin system RelE/ParE family toxin [Methylovulum sp.]
MKLSFLEAAEAELQAAMDYYNLQKSGLGQEFLAEIKAMIDRITNFPEAWQPLSRRTRRCLSRRFPYGIIYQIRDDEILIIAVSHLHQKPMYWQDRL